MFKLINLFVVLTVFCVATNAAPYQELPPKPGHVPVYIRVGNTPLREVNPKLVEAFHENEQSNQLETEIQNPKESQNDDVLKQNIKENENEKDEQRKIVNEEQRTSNEQDGLISDIAEFTSDDIKTFNDDKADNETKEMNE